MGNMIYNSDFVGFNVMTYIGIFMGESFQDYS